MKNFYSGLIILLFLFGSCTYDKQVDPLEGSGYPTEVGKIIVNKCATAGCHNSLSRANAGGLDFSTWDLMFEGGRNGSSVIPFSTDYSYMLYFINTDSTRGPALLPTMPQGETPLTNEEFQILYSWVHNGARNENDFVKFSDDPNRKKFYVCMQGCDQVAVFDAQSKVIMRYIPVGVDPTIEAPHLVRVSPDGEYWYVVFYSGHVLQKFRTSDDSYVGALEIGTGDWNTIIFSPDSKKGFVNATIAGITKVVDLENMAVETSLSIDFPHGGFTTSDGEYAYITSQTGNFITKVEIDGPFYDVDKIALGTGENTSTASKYDAHEMILSPDEHFYYVSCQKSNEVRVMERERSSSDDTLIAVIPVGNKPQEFSLSETRPYLFVSCTEDSTMGTRKKGSVYVINYLTNQVIKKIYTGYQPHGIAVDDDHDCVYVANLNYDNSGPAPHHVSTCGGRNGYLTVIDMSTLELYQKKLSDGSSFEYRNELLSFPYFVSYRK
ncbi:MAG: YncE family protein [Bacteroidetes bacterium]|nr:YncE family protein [Bacteroidota bacterium]